MAALLEWYAANAWYGGLLVFILGLCVGSFLNVCIYRIPNKISIRTPASHCPSCRARLTLPDMVPVVSYLALRGRCRHCGGRISPRYPSVELLTGALYLLCWWRVPGLRLLPALVLTAVLVAAAFIDAEHAIIPNGLTFFGFVAGAACLPFVGIPHWRDALLGLLVGGAPLLLIDVVSRLILRKDGMGGGDVKLMAMAGLYLGFRSTLLSLMLAVVGGGLTGVGLLVSRRLKPGDYFPFGPFLAAGAFLSMTFGGDILALYAQLNQAIIGVFLG